MRRRHLQTGGPVSKVPDLDPLLPPGVVSPEADSIDNRSAHYYGYYRQSVESNDGTAALANHLFKITAILRQITPPLESILVTYLYFETGPRPDPARR